MRQLRQLLEDREQFPIQPGRVLPAKDLDVLLTPDDVPLLEGLCYRLHQESLRAEPTPGKHFLKLLDPDVLPLIVKASRGHELDRNERDEVLEGLNEVLQHNEFWNANAFARLRGMKEYVRILKFVQLLDAQPKALLKERRLILQLCYPLQIVPLSERNKLNAKAREDWQLRARIDLDAARRENEGAKR
jgi:hypothetical protein